MKIVQFQNGKWAIQKGWIFKEYRCKKDGGIYPWWREDSPEHVAEYCLFDTKEEALNLAESLKLKVIYSEKV